MTKLRFGVNFGGVDVEDWRTFCRDSERLGFDVVHTADHLGVGSPFAMLATAAEVTNTVRLGTLVVNTAFWNPAMLAREAATVDRLSGGRLELGLGAGHMKSEFDAAGIPWPSHAERMDHLEHTIAELDRLFAQDGQSPLPRQVPHPPLLIGGHGNRALDVAARHANIIGFSGAIHAPGKPPGTFLLASYEQTRQRVEYVRQRSGTRAESLEYNVLLQAVFTTDDAEASAADLADRFGATGLDTAEKVLENPYVLVGSPEENARKLLDLRDTFGFGYFSTHGPFRDALAEVIPHVRRLEAEAAVPTT
ncbi:TIGR03621 family F420-dependent LLM class oxidoreductase [Spiractinospora alimapuensis]|uniref:TIGR03621 family F420-dependent LLM class oxidoreductase n=1 Tax=Spiractinospora alimapuensis TaxID=2820884 RepID=UPI001F294E72|nr:TIGR03621 family F420-dependent LLM class oxidoreductase [Spiractinospora alimapuensis]QVQ52665.1 TIGR03621 family F420-dependent LLM class oxidoreductase [Spiractinospora alimapuensis]